MRKFEKRFPGMGIEGRLIGGRVGVNGTSGQVGILFFRGNWRGEKTTQRRCKFKGGNINTEHSGENPEGAERSLVAALLWMTARGEAVTGSVGRWDAWWAEGVYG